MSYDKETLILSHLQLAQDIATREWRTATHVLKRDDMVSLAYLGLVDAADRWVPYCEKKNYDPSAVQYFKVFAGLRIRGTIRDYIRKEDWATRTLRSKSKKLKTAGQDDGISLEELVEKTGMTKEEIHKVNAKLAVRPVSLDAKSGLTEYDSTSKDLQIREGVDTEGIAFANSMVETFVDSVKAMPFETQVVLCMHYYAKVDLRKIAEELSLPEVKVSLLHSSAITELRDILTTAALERE